MRSSFASMQMLVAMLVSSCFADCEALIIAEGIQLAARHPQFTPLPVVLPLYLTDKTAWVGNHLNASENFQ